MSKLRQPIIRVRREGGRATSAPERPPVVALLQIGEAVVLLPDGQTAASVRVRGFALKVRP